MQLITITFAYLHIFNRLTDIIKLMESVDETTEQVEAEELCIE